MQSLKVSLCKLLALVLAIALCGAPELMQAARQSDTATPQTQTQAPATPPTASGTKAPSPSGTSVDPTQGPLEPVPQSQEPPEAPSAQSAPTGSPQAPPVASPNAESQAPVQKPSEPVGTATAQRTPTSGGAASKPAGTAIAPAKQRQVHSLFLKLGLIAGAAVAIGTVTALSQKTPSTPPGAAAK